MVHPNHSSSMMYSIPLLIDRLGEWISSVEGSEDGSSDDVTEDNDVTELGRWVTELGPACRWVGLADK